MPSGITVNVNPNDAALTVVTVVPDGRIKETTTPGSLVVISKTLFPVESASTVNGNTVELEWAGMPEPRVS